LVLAWDQHRRPDQALEAGLRIVSLTWGSGVLLIRTLALLTILGSQTGADDRGHRATSGHVRPLLLQLNGTSGCILHRPAALRDAF
jgi:hypothetical protein